jgi:hypothetical protein
MSSGVSMDPLLWYACEVLFMRRFRTYLFVLLLIVLVALALTYPAVLRLGDGSALPGLRDFDEFEYAWLLWWYKVSLVDQHTSPGDLPFYYPMETQQPLVDVTPLGWLLSIPLVLALGPVRAYAAYWLLNFVLCAFTAYLLGFWLTRCRYAAFIGALIFAFYPGKMLHGLGHFGDMMIYMFPLYALFLLKFFERPVWRYAGLLTAVTTIGLLIDFRHLGLFYFPFTAIFLLYQLVTAPRRLFSPPVIRLGLLSLAAVFLLTLPFFGPFLLSSLGGQLGHLKEGGLEASSADALSFILPPMTHPVLGQVPPLKRLMEAVWTESLYIETCLYMGIVAVALAVVALVRRRKAWLWLMPILVGSVLALGPVLKVAGVQVGDLPLPYALVHRLPFYEWVRIPARMDMMIKLCLAMLAAMGTRELIHRLPRGRQVLVSIAIGALILFEYLTLMPYPMADVVRSPFLEGLAGDGDDYGIMHLTSHEYAMYLQTLHGHPMVEGHIHRWPPGGSEWALQLHGLALYPPEMERAYWDIIDEELPYGRDGGDVFAGALDVSPARILSRLNIRYVVFDRRFGWTSHDKKLYRARLREYFGDPIHEDGRLTIHEVRGDVPPGPELMPGTGWLSLEGGERERWRWMEDRATIQVNGVSEGSYRLMVAVRPPTFPKHLSVGVNGELVKDYLVERRREIITPKFRLDSGNSTIDLSVEDGCERPFNLLQGNLDDRCLGIAFYEVRLFPSSGEPRRFGEQVALMGQEIAFGGGDDGALYLNLYWQALDRMDRDHTVFVHLVDRQGRRIAQEDRLLVNRWGNTTSAWDGSEGVRTLHRLELPPEVDADEVRLKVGVYDVTGMERLPLLADESGENVVVLDH